MAGVIVIAIVLGAILPLQQQHIQKDKREKTWVYGFSVLTLVTSLLFAIPIPVERMTKYVNDTVGALTHWVINR